MSIVPDVRTHFDKGSLIKQACIGSVCDDGFFAQSDGWPSSFARFAREHSCANKRVRVTAGSMSTSLYYDTNQKSSFLSHVKNLEDAPHISKAQVPEKSHTSGEGGSYRSSSSTSIDTSRNCLGEEIWWNRRFVDEPHFHLASLKSLDSLPMENTV